MAGRVIVLILELFYLCRWRQPVWRRYNGFTAGIMLSRHDNNRGPCKETRGFLLQPPFFLSRCSRSQKLAEQLSARRPQLPGGGQLCVRAHRPLLREGRPCTWRWQKETADALAAQHISLYEDDPVSSVYCTRPWRQDSHDPHELFYKLVPLIWNS